jgi:putative membrane protein
MLTKKRYSVIDIFLWTRIEVLGFLVFAFVIAALYEIMGYTFLDLPFTPLALIGTAVAFVIGFQNNSAYDRAWEARKIWGGIVNTSRTWAMKASDMVSNEHADVPVSDEELMHIKKRLIYRHIAWLTALRHGMRKERKWEVMREHKTNKEWQDMLYIPEKITSEGDDLLHYLEPEEHNYVMSIKNKSAAILFLQSRDIRELKERGLIWGFSFLELENVLEELFTLQGKSERIKNFPYPRQYATLANYFVWIFVVLLPFALIPEFAGIGDKFFDQFPLISKYFTWVAVPFTAAVSWVFHTMERIGRSGENPFEGSSNDVPISTIARGIEIDLLQLIKEVPEMIPAQFPEKHNVQM